MFTLLQLKEKDKGALERSRYLVFRESLGVYILTLNASQNVRDDKKRTT